MGKINNIWNFLARNKYLVTVVVGLSLVGVIDENSWRKYVILSMRESELKYEINQYHEQYMRDSISLRALEAGHSGVEKVARERYFMKRPNEDIFILSTDQREAPGEQKKQ